MESAYSLANAEIKRIRRENSELLSRREDEVREKAPEFAMVEAQLRKGGLSIARGILDGVNNVPIARKCIEEAQAKRAEILDKLNLPKDYLDEIYTCKKCRDTGFSEDGRRCECLKKMISKYIGINSNLTEAMREQTFNSFDMSLFEKQEDVKGTSVLEIAKKAYKKSIEFAETFEETHGNLYLYGSAGTGKTFVSSCIANRVLERGFTVYYQSAFKLLDMLEKLKFGRYEDEERAQAEYAEKYIYDVDLLIIDDVGTEFVTAYSSAALFDIINSRIVDKKSTIISSNLGPVKMTEVYGTRLASRITGSFDVVNFIGKDLRRIKK